MPIYEYQCEKCGHRLEALQKLADEPLKFCPECSESALKKLISASGFILKGSGWYVTDFRDKGKPKTETKSDGGSASNSETKSESKSESKTESKSESKSDTTTKPAPKASTSAASD